MDKHRESTENPPPSQDVSSKIQPAAQHTPGPWYLSEKRIGVNGHNEKGFAGFPVATTSVQNSDERRKADARLIAAAPELLKTCERVLEDLSEDEKMDARFAVICDMLRDQIAKARGGVSR